MLSTTTTLFTSNDHRLRNLLQSHSNHPHHQLHHHHQQQQHHQPQPHKSSRSKLTSTKPFSSLTSTSLSTRPKTATSINLPSPNIHPDHQSSHSVHNPSQSPNLSPTQSLRRASSTPILLNRALSMNSKRKTRTGTISPVELRSALIPQSTTLALSKPDPSLTLKESSIPQPLISNLQKKLKRKSDMKLWEASGSVANTGTPTFSPSLQIQSNRTQASSPELGPRTPTASARIKSNKSPLQSEPSFIEQSSKALRRSKGEDRRKKKPIDFTTYPQNELILRLANLLQQISVSNDRIDEPRSASGATAMSEWSIPKGSRRPSTGSALSSPGATWDRRTVKATGRPDQSPTVAYFQQHQTQLETGTPTFESDEFEFGQIRASQGLHPNQLTTASKSALSSPSALLTFHAKHVPQISIEAYLRRIQKYCPMTNEVFVGVLVFLDRMSGIRGQAGEQFVIDSWNVHRFLIATVTATSKFFSDVFYTNSRYAKVGGLPLKELDQLELQFLLLNDFRLMISTEELNQYGAQLLAPLPNESQDEEEEEEEEEEVGEGHLEYRPLSWSEESSEATITPGSPGSVVTASSFNSS